MIRGLYTAATGMNAMQHQIDVTSNNIANVNTTGFKKDRAEGTHQKTPIIMITTEGGKGEVITALKAGVNNYIVKPFNAE
ncbi:flagellar basal body protein, partial [Aliarcobacter butzleri]|uniref:flagellar basal body protein n=1 Tax=Aliarcobacter butzleri TaxID=28197 RepID=UPI00263F4163